MRWPKSAAAGGDGRRCRAPNCASSSSSAPSSMPSTSGPAATSIGMPREAARMATCEVLPPPARQMPAGPAASSSNSCEGSRLSASRIVRSGNCAAVVGACPHSADSIRALTSRRSSARSARRLSLSACSAADISATAAVHAAVADRPVSILRRVAAASSTSFNIARWARAISAPSPALPCASVSR